MDYAEHRGVLLAHSTPLLGSGAMDRIGAEVRVRFEAQGFCVIDETTAND